jgi:uncharacterized protein YlxW (UPF0749 family)
MMVRRHLLRFCVALVLLVAANQTPCIADSQADADKRQHQDLLDQEKRLLEENDKLQQDLLVLKREINEKVDKLESAQDKLDRVRHQLITVRMKLMP